MLDSGDTYTYFRGVIELKNKIVAWVTTTQKATSAALSAVTMLAAASFVPDPYRAWAAVGVVILSWVVTYFVPFVKETVESFPDDVASDTHSLDQEPVTEEIPITVMPPVTGQVVVNSPETVDPYPTQGIPVVEGDDAREDMLTVADILTRLKTEAGKV